MAVATGSVGSKNAASGAGSQYDESFMPSGALRVAEGHGRYLDSVLRGRCFLAANQTGSAVTNLNATATGFILINPIGSGFYLSLLHMGFQQTTAATTAVNSLLLAFGAVSATAVTGLTSLTVRNLPLGVNGIGVGLAASAATLPAAPVGVMNLWAPSVSATATTGIPAPIVFDLGGLITIAPGSTLSISTLNALTGASHMVWEEVPVNANYL